MKYISHGYYNQEIAYQGVQFRNQIQRARYIKSALQSFDGVDVIQNNLRPSTVVFKTVDNWVSSRPGYKWITR